MPITTVLGIILAIAATYFVFTDARSRGRDMSVAFLWAFGVLLLPIVFLPLYLLFGRKIKPRPVPPAQIPDNVIDIESAEVTTINCPMCASRVNEEYKICPHCGYTLQPVCKNCGQRLDRKWAVCPHCQTPAEEK